MKRIVITQPEQKTVTLDSIDNDTPIFAKRNGNKLCGMVVKDDGGWILKLGGEFGANGFHKTRENLIKRASEDHGYEFFVMG